MGRYPLKQRIALVIPSSLLVWFLSFGPKILSANHCLLLLFEIFSEWLDFLTSFFVRQFSITCSLTYISS